MMNDNKDFPSYKEIPINHLFQKHGLLYTFYIKKFIPLQNFADIYDKIAEAPTDKEGLISTVSDSMTDITNMKDIPGFIKDTDYDEEIDESKLQKLMDKNKIIQQYDLSCEPEKLEGVAEGLMNAMTSFTQNPDDWAFIMTVLSARLGLSFFNDDDVEEDEDDPEF